MAYEIFIPPYVWNEIRCALLESRVESEEVFCYIFASAHSLGPNVTRLIFRDFVIPGKSSYVEQSRSYLKLSQTQHLDALNKFVRRGFSIIHIHTHPGEQMPSFSRTDDEGEARYARFLGEYRPAVHFISGVFNESMTLSRWRSWQTTDPFLCQYDVEIEQQKRDIKMSANKRLARQEVFGSRFQDKLASMSVSLIGCGGIGAVFAEQLSRLGVRRWTLIDNDRIEDSNLNRLPFGTGADVGRYKTEYVSDLIARGCGTRRHVVQIRADIDNAKACRLAARSQILVVATDTHSSRIKAQSVASRFGRRLISLASHIYCDEPGEARFFARISMPPNRPGGWSLVSAGVVSNVVAAKERAPSELTDEFEKQGYISDVPAPAVYWLNSITASCGVRLIHLLAIGKDFEDGIDQVIDLRDMQIMTIKHQESDCYFVSNNEFGIFGAGYIRL